MSALDFVTIETDIEGINHDVDHYETKDMKLWGRYLIDKEGKLFRKDDDTPEWAFENFTGKFSIVGNAAGYYDVSFVEGEMTSMVHWMYRTWASEECL